MWAAVENELTSVGRDTGTLSELRDHAPAFRTLILTMSAQNEAIIQNNKVHVFDDKTNTVLDT